MFKLTSTLVGIAGFAVAASMLAPAAIAQVKHETRPAQFKAVTAPKPGDCKTSVAIGIGQSPQMAQAAWAASVNGQFGSHWSNWMASKGKQVIPQGSGAAQQFQAMSIPCLYYPVG